MKEVIYSTNVKEELVPGKNYNSLIVSIPGNGKTYSYMMPNIASMLGNYVVVETKNKMYDEYASYLRDNGYKVMRCDLDTFTNSIHYNPISFLKTSQDVTEMCHTLIPLNAQEKDPYWNNMARILLEHYIYATLEFQSKEKQNMSTVFDLFTEDVPVGNLKYGSKYYQWVNEVSDKYPESFTAQSRKWVGGIVGVDTTFNCIRSCMAAGISSFQSQKVLKHCEKNELDLEAFRNEKVALFINISDVKTANHKIASLLISHIIKTLIDIADSSENKMLKEHCFLMLDDAASYLSAIPNLNEFMSVSRSRNISTSIICQSIAQLEANGFRISSIVDNVSKIMYLGSMDPNTIEYFGRMTGNSRNDLCFIPEGKLVLIDVKKGARIDDRFDLYSHPFYTEREVSNDAKGLSR